jgi:hypothetical protein
MPSVGNVLLVKGIRVIAIRITIIRVIIIPLTGKILLTQSIIAKIAKQVHIRKKKTC